MNSRPTTPCAFGSAKIGVLPSLAVIVTNSVNHGTLMLGILLCLPAFGEVGGHPPDAVVLPIQLGVRAGTSSLGADNFGFVPNIVAFDRVNQPWVMEWPRSTTGVFSFQKLSARGQWESVSPAGALPRSFQSGPWSQIMTGFHASFDADGEAYVLADGTGSPAGRWTLLHSRDGGAHWKSIETPLGAMPGGFKEASDRNANFARLERRDAWTPSSYPPVVLGNDDKNLLLLDVRKSLGKPLDVSRIIRLAKVAGDLDNPVRSRSQAGWGGFGHDGGLRVVSLGDKVHVVFARSTPEPGLVGTPAYAVTYDRKSGQVTATTLLGATGVEIDGHNFPVIAADRRGFLHVILSAHGGKRGQHFVYRRSLEANSTGVWEAPVPLPSGCTYPTLLCDRAGNLHLVARGTDGKLVYDRKPAGQPWEPRRDLVVPADRGRYALYFQSLSQDREGRIYLSYRAMNRTSGVASPTADQKDYPPVLLVSTDNGLTWHLADTAWLTGLRTQNTKRESR